MLFSQPLLTLTQGVLRDSVCNINDLLTHLSTHTLVSPVQSNHWLSHLSFEKTTPIDTDRAQLFTAVKQPPQPATFITSAAATAAPLS